MEPTARNITPYTPKTEQEKAADAFRLLDGFEKELARQLALREVLAKSLTGRGLRHQQQRLQQISM